MPFSELDIRRRFFILAKGKCECCSNKLVWENRDRGLDGAWHAHHVIPANANPDDTVFNMAILCINEPDNCHANQAHGGKLNEIQPKTKWKYKNNYYMQMIQNNIK